MKTILIITFLIITFLAMTILWQNLEFETEIKDIKVISKLNGSIILISNNKAYKLKCDQSRMQMN